MLIKNALVVALALGLVSTAMAAGTSSKSTPRKAGDYELGVKAVKAANYEKALNLLRKVVAAKPGNADAWNYIGLSQRKLKKFDQALGAYRKALAIDPDHRGANEYLGELYLDMGQVGGAEQRPRFVDGLLIFGFGVAVGNHATAGLNIHGAVLDDRGAQHDAAVHIAVGCEIADAARIRPARIGLQLGNDLARANLGRAADGAGGKACEQRVDRVLFRRDAADDVRHDVHDMAVKFDAVAFRHRHRAGGFQAGHEGARRLVLIDAVDHQRIGEVAARRVNGNPHLPFARLRGRYFR